MFLRPLLLANSNTVVGHCLPVPEHRDLLIRIFQVETLDNDSIGMQLEIL